MSNQWRYYYYQSNHSTILEVKNCNKLYGDQLVQKCGVEIFLSSGNNNNSNNNNNNNSKSNKSISCLLSIVLILIICQSRLLHAYQRYKNANNNTLTPWMFNNSITNSTSTIAPLIIWSRFKLTANEQQNQQQLSLEESSHLTLNNNIKPAMLEHRHHYHYYQNYHHHQRHKRGIILLLNLTIITIYFLVCNLVLFLPLII